MTRRDDDLAKARVALHERLCAMLGSNDPMPEFTEALTHPSCSHETGRPSNQRLEFLGDAVLGLCASELLATTNPDADEGVLTRMRSAIVSTGALAAWAESLAVGPAIAFGKGARSGDERHQANVLADAVEALIACVYLHHGISGARSVVAQLIHFRAEQPLLLAKRDPKSELQERVQALGFESPRYVMAQSEGPLHNATFQIEVRVGEQLLGLGSAKSKKVAEREAAQAALEIDFEALLRKPEQTE
jgi:ribonuclease III